MYEDSSSLNPLREELSRLEDKLNEMTRGEFYGDFVARGLETYKVREIGRLLLRYPNIRDVLRECITRHKEFYEKLLGSPLTDDRWKNDTSVQNILKLYQHFASKFSLDRYIKLKRR